TQWNQQGPPGQNGKDGAQGPAGTSTVYESKSNTNVDMPNGNDTNVNSLALPAGTYFVSAAAVVENGDDDGHFACALEDSPGPGQPRTLAFTASASTGGELFETIPMVSTVVHSGAGTVSIFCSEGHDQK